MLVIKQLQVFHHRLTCAAVLAIWRCFEAEYPQKSPQPGSRFSLRNRPPKSLISPFLPVPAGWSCKGAAYAGTAKEYPHKNMIARIPQEFIMRSDWDGDFSVSERPSPDSGPREHNPRGAGTQTLQLMERATSAFSAQIFFAASQWQTGKGSRNFVQGGEDPVALHPS